MSPGERFVMGLIAGSVGGAVAAPVGFALIAREFVWGVGIIAPFGAVAGAFWGGAFGFALPDTISEVQRLVRGTLLGMVCVALTPFWTPFMLIRAVYAAVDLHAYVAPGTLGRWPAGLMTVALLFFGPGALAGLIGAWVLGRLERWWVVGKGRTGLGETGGGSR